MKISLRRAVLFAALVLQTSMLANGQDLDDVTISGKVRDSHNLPIAGAMVIATHAGTNTQRTTVTSEEGAFRFAELRPGSFNVRAQAAGFGDKEAAGLNALSGQNLRIDITLSPADVTASATVAVGTGNVAAVDTTRVLVGGTISQREIEEIPNNSRNPLDLVLTLGGTSEEQLSTSGLAEDRFQSAPTAPLEQGNFSLSGGVAYSNNLTIDGLDNNDDRSSRDRFQL